MQELGEPFSSPERQIAVMVKLLQKFSVHISQSPPEKSLMPQQLLQRRQRGVLPLVERGAALSGGCKHRFRCSRFGGKVLKLSDYAVQFFDQLATPRLDERGNQRAVIPKRAFFAAVE